MSRRLVHIYGEDSIIVTYARSRVRYKVNEKVTHSTDSHV